jgi:hypothetical protein
VTKSKKELKGEKKEEEKSQIEGGKASEIEWRMSWS